MMFILISAGLGALGFMLLWFVRKKSIAPGQPKPVSIEVMERSNKRTTLRNPPRFCWLAGLLYSSLFYWGLPILIWRYGIYRALGLIVLPIVVSIGIPYLAAEFFGLISVEEKIMVGFFALIAIRSIVGVHVATNDLKYRKSALYMRGWKIYDPREKIKAMKYF
jgi:hypothetical protein